MIRERPACACKKKEKKKKKKDGILQHGHEQQSIVYSLLISSGLGPFKTAGTKVARIPSHTLESELSEGWAGTECT